MKPLVIVYEAYKDDSFGRGGSASCAIGMPCRDFKTHTHISKLYL